MIHRTVDSLTPAVYMALGILLATLSIIVTDAATSGALLCAACCSVALTGVKWGRRDAVTVPNR